LDLAVTKSRTRGGTVSLAISSGQGTLQTQRAATNPHAELG